MAEQALQIAQLLEDVNYEMRLLIGIGGVCAFGPQPERSQEYFDKAANLAMNNVIDDKIIQMKLLNFLGLEYERRGDYYRLLTEFQLERLYVSQEIGHRLLESEALHSCGLIKAIYLGDYASGLSDLQLCRSIINNTPDEVYTVMHIAYIQMMLGDYSDALATLQYISMIGEPPQEGGKAGYQIFWIMYYNALGKRAATRSDKDEIIKNLTEALSFIEKTRDLSKKSSFVSVQYQMAVECHAVITHLGLARTAEQPEIIQNHLASALKSGERAYDIYQEFGYTQIVECVSEEVLFRYSQALSANREQDLALRYLQRAYDEMIKKLEMIPLDSHYRKTYLEQIPLHQEIRAAYAVRTGALTYHTYTSA
jgi:tetratricopeptide (TPR) repeat protein